jgi:sec-independent protein translocase protein TatA
MGLGLDNPSHIAVLVVVLLLVFGAKRLPEIGKSLGAGIREFKGAVTGETRAIAAVHPATDTAPAGAEAPAATAQWQPASPALQQQANAVVPAEPVAQAAAPADQGD